MTTPVSLVPTGRSANQEKRPRGGCDVDWTEGNPGEPVGDFPPDCSPTNGYLALGTRSSRQCQIDRGNPVELDGSRVAVLGR